MKLFSSLILTCLFFSQANLFADENLYYQELYSNEWTQVFKADKIIYENHDNLQDTVIFENPLYGRVMMLDGIIQVCEADEFNYHEMITHVPLTAHPNPKKVLIIGGGDGGVLREILKHPTIEKVTMVDIDSTVIELSKQYLPSISEGAFKNPKAKVIIDDGAKFVKNVKEKFDVIIVDSTDPIGPGKVLFTFDFYQDCKNLLTTDGILVCQSGCPFIQSNDLIAAHHYRKQLFKHASVYLTVVPTYIGGHMALSWATNSDLYDDLDTKALNERIAEIKGSLKYYNAQVHKASFSLPNFVKDQLGD